MFRFLIFLLPFLLLASCGNPPFRGKEVVGADEFVMDSYRIREGKIGVLELTGNIQEALNEADLQEYNETLQEGDILSISLIQSSSKELTQALTALSQSSSLVVRNSTLLLPELGSLKVAGLTLAETQKMIQQAYDKLYKGSQVYISIKESSGNRIYLSGMVTASTLIADGKLRLFEALSLAKVPTNANLFRSYVARNGQMLPVDLQRLIKEGDMSQNIVLKGGDKIYIADPASSNVMVMGEVAKPTVIPVADGYMTIKKALADAGGIPYTGDRSYIQVIRGTLQNPKIYTLNFRHIMRLPSDSMLLIPGDVVYVATTPLGEWNNFVSQVLPTIIGADLITRGGRNIGINANP